MKNKLVITQVIMILSIFIFSVNAYSDDDESGVFKRWIENRNTGVSEVKFKQYDELCGSCHFSYQPGLLPGHSWEKIMSDPENHYGLKLNMRDVEVRTMRRYLLDNSAGHVNDEISHNILRTLKFSHIPIRITQTPYFLKKHGSYKNNQNIGQCHLCHQDAQQGQYKTENIYIDGQSQLSSRQNEIKM
ncbi:MAG: diheme cytochrome c [Gammaproteobacteria bacterium]|nr:diheme cytochrome c [Gammaproteobacteria bacterium]